MEKLNTTLAPSGTSQDNAESKEKIASVPSSSVGTKPVIRPITPGGAVDEPKADTHNDDDKKSTNVLKKIDYGLKSIDTGGEYLLVTIVALLVGVIIGLAISFL